MIVLALPPQAQARDSAKFKLLSISGTESFTRDVVYPPSDFGSCAFAMTERISFHSTKRATAYAFTSKAHGRARVAWSPAPATTRCYHSDSGGRLDFTVIGDDRATPAATIAA